MGEETRKWNLLKLVQLPAEDGRLPSKSVYSLAVVYLALHSLVLTVLSLFRDFSPIQMYS